MGTSLCRLSLYKVYNDNQPVQQHITTEGVSRYRAKSRSIWKKAGAAVELQGHLEGSGARKTEVVWEKELPVEGPTRTRKKTTVVLTWQMVPSDVV